MIFTSDVFWPSLQGGLLTKRDMSLVYHEREGNRSLRVRAIFLHAACRYKVISAWRRSNWPRYPSLSWDISSTMQKIARTRSLLEEQKTLLFCVLPSVL